MIKPLPGTNSNFLILILNALTADEQLVPTEKVVIIALYTEFATSLCTQLKKNKIKSSRFHS